MKHGIEHDVTCDGNALLDALLFQVFARRLRGAEQPGGDMVREHAVLLLRHAHVVGAQTGLHVGHGDVQLAGGQRAGQRGVRVAVHQKDIRLFALDDLLHADQHFACLPAVRAGAHAELIGGAGNAQLLEENIGHILIIVLAGVHDELLAQRLEGSADDGSLDKLRACAHNCENLQASSPFFSGPSRRRSTCRAWRRRDRHTSRAGPSSGSCRRPARASCP